MFESTKIRAKEAQAIAKKHFEDGNQSKSLKAVWRRYARPTMGVCYPTFLSYLKIKVD